MQCMYTIYTCFVTLVCRLRGGSCYNRQVQIFLFLWYIFHTGDPPQVRVRCVGEQGSGHGTYSEAVIFTTPGNRESVSKAASVRSEASSSTAGDAGRALALTSSGKGRKGSTNPAEADGLLPGQGSSNKAKKSARKGPGTGEKVAFIRQAPSEFNEV